MQAGAEALDATRDVAWMGPYGWYDRFPGDLRLLAATRDPIDWGARRRVAALPNLSVHHRCDVAGLVPGPRSWPRVAGVRIRPRLADTEFGRCDSEFATDLIVVADGGNSRLPRWLTALGYRAPAETVVNSFHGYASWHYRPHIELEADTRRVGRLARFGRIARSGS